MLIHELLDRSAQTHPQRIAVEEDEGGAITYENLAALSKI